MKKSAASTFLFLSAVRDILAYAAPIGVITYLGMIIMERAIPRSVSLYTVPDDWLIWVIAIAVLSYFFPKRGNIVHRTRAVSFRRALVILALGLAIFGTYQLLPRELLQSLPVFVQIFFAGMTMSILFWLTVMWTESKPKQEKKNESSGFLALSAGATLVGFVKRIRLGRATRYRKK